MPRLLIPVSGRGTVAQVRSSLPWTLAILASGELLSVNDPCVELPD